MRFTATAFAGIAVLALAVDLGTHADGARHTALQVVYTSTGSMALLWGLLVLANGGPRRFYASARAWASPASPGLPALVPAVTVATHQVVQEFRPSASRYGRHAVGVARGATVAAGAVLAYAAFMLQGSGPAVWWVLLGAIAVAVAIGGGWVLLILARSRVEFHPNGVTLAGAFRTVVLDNTTNSLVIRGEARSGLHSLGSLWVDRATGHRCAVWESVFDLPRGGLDPLVRGTVGRSVIRERPDREIAAYVSLGERRPLLPLAVVVYLIVLTATLVALQST